MEKNLDLECAKYGSKLEDTGETLLRKSLGVLQEDGVYAFYLYLQAQKDNSANKIQKETFELLKKQIQVLRDESDILKAIRDKLADKLDSLLLAKQLLERTLVYARYHAKACEVKK